MQNYLIPQILTQSKDKEIDKAELIKIAFPKICFKDTKKLCHCHN